MSTTGFLTPILIGSYQEMLTFVASDVRDFEKCRTTNLHMRLLFFTPSVIGSIKNRMLILTSWQAVFMVLNGWQTKTSF